MPENRIQVTYATPSHLQTSEQWNQLHTGLIAQFPLRNLHWKPATRLSLRTIQDLDVKLVPFESVREENVSQIPASLLNKPLLNLYIVTCEDNETYKNSVKKQIKDWHSIVTQRRNQEWLVIFVVRPDARTASGGILKMRGALIDRVKADFNVDKRDRCVQLVWSENNDPATWVEAISKIKEGITLAFDSGVAQREEEVKRSEGQKLMPGWNFCTFFILKESVASSFEGMNLLDDALIQYDELEASFFQVLKDKNLAWFGKLIDNSPRDDSMPLLSVIKKPYRDLILANTISVFDFRVYLLARQCSLLGRMGQTTVIGKKVALFLGAFGKRLRDVQDELPEYFIESWIYSSALSTVEICNEWERGFSSGNIDSGSSAVKGELHELALGQLNRIGMKLEYLPNRAPFTFCGEGDVASIKNTGSPAGISNSDLLALIKSRTSFYDHYIRLTNKAIEQHVKAGRRKFALKLHGCLAALEAFRGRNRPALQTYTSLPAHYNPNQWCDLEAHALLSSLQNYKLIGSGHDREWLHTALAFMKAYVIGMKKALLIGADEIEARLGELASEVCKAASCLETDMILQSHPLFVVKPLTRSCRISDNGDAYILDIDIYNELPIALSVDEISVTASRSSSTSLCFSVMNIIVERGLSKKSLICEIPLPGIFAVEMAEVRVGRLRFQWSSSVPNHANDPGPSKQLLRLPKNKGALDISVEQPRRVCYGDEREVLISLKPGRVAMDRVKLKFSSSDLQLLVDRCRRSDSSGIEINADGEVGVSLGVSSKLDLLLPYVLSSSCDRATIGIDIAYGTTNNPTKTRSLSISKQVSIAQHLAVNVTDHFRGERLFSTFTVSTTSNQHVYVYTAELISKDHSTDMSHLSFNYKSSRRTIVTPSQPARFTFQLKNTSKACQNLAFCIKYSLLREGVEDIVSQTIMSLPDISDYNRNAVHNTIIRALESDASWVHLYECTGEIHVPDCQTTHDIAREASIVREKLRSSSSIFGSENVLREAIMSVDVPHIDIIAAARIRLSPVSEGTENHSPMRTSFFAGQPIRAVLTIRVSFRWSGQERMQDDTYRLRFNVEEMLKHWLISGQRQGEIMAKNETTFSVTFTLMALRHGELALPQVRLSALSTPASDGLKHQLVPTLECHQEHGAERVTIYPRASRTTFMFEMTQDP